MILPLPVCDLDLVDLAVLDEVDELGVGELVAAPARPEGRHGRRPPSRTPMAIHGPHLRTQVGASSGRSPSSPAGPAVGGPCRVLRRTCRPRPGGGGGGGGGSLSMATAYGPRRGCQVVRRCRSGSGEAEPGDALRSRLGWTRRGPCSARRGRPPSVRLPWSAWQDSVLGRDAVSWRRSRSPTSTPTPRCGSTTSRSERDPHAYDLCGRHAERLTAPRGLAGP